MQETRAQSLVREDPTCHGPAKPGCRNYWACGLEPGSLNIRNPHTLEPMRRNKRSLSDGKPTRHKEKKKKKPMGSIEYSAQSKIKKKNFF